MNFKIKIKKKSSIDILMYLMLIALLVSMIFASMTLKHFSFFFIYLLLAIFCIYIISKIKTNKENDYTYVLIFPTFLSAFQNIYFGIFIKYIDSNTLKMLLVINYVFVTFFCLIWYVISNIRNDAIINVTVCSIVILSLYSVVLMIFNSTNFQSFFASYRNIISEFLFFLFGYFLSKHTSFERYGKCILSISLVVIAVGFYEIFLNRNMWISLNIGQLWQKKGIRISSWQLPNNFVSSEFIGNSVIRRMASTFADPVNLGTFLLFAVIIAWYFKKYIICILSILACGLTVSKGAFVGLLIFVFIYAYYKDNTKLIAILSLLLCAFIGFSFINYSKTNSSGSVFLHISGFLNSFNVFIEKPFGYGCGNVGVMSQLLYETSSSSITESGLGAIIGQLGIVGIMIYLIFYLFIFRRIIKLKDKREKILLVSLFFSIVINIAFNEVGLSPNSCGPYFIVFGLLMNN